MGSSYRSRDPFGLGCFGVFFWLALPVVLVGGGVIWGVNSFFGTDIGRDPNAPSAAVHVREFISPDKEVLCRFGTVVRCVTVSPPRSVTLNKKGIIHVCSGARRCVGHVELDGVPKLAYNHGASYTGYLCHSDQRGITCYSKPSFKNFLINKRGVFRSG
jgi:hypothetical protein